MKRDDMRELNKELNCTGYTVNKVKSMGNEIADIMARIELSSGMVEEGLLDEEIYKNFVARQKREIKDILYETYKGLGLDEAEGHFDYKMERQDKK